MAPSVEEVARANPTVTKFHVQIAASHTNIGAAHQAMNEPAKALADLPFPVNTIGKSPDLSGIGR
jgi:hypothetical protein